MTQPKNHLRCSHCGRYVSVVHRGRTTTSYSKVDPRNATNFVCDRCIENAVKGAIAHARTEANDVG